jgi:hypothetical protein
MIRRRHAFSVLETLIALVIFSLAALVILSSGGSIHEQSYQNEFRAMGAIRARTLSSFVRALDFDALKALLGNGDWKPIDLEKLFEPGELDFALKPAQRQSLASRKMAQFHHEIKGRVKGDLIELEVVVQWELPAERRNEPHEYKLISAMSRPAVCFALEKAPCAGGALSRSSN